jgi:hypothetical protein
MKYLTRDWYDGGHDDDVYFAYRRYLTGISENLPASVLALALSDLHDARFLNVAHDQWNDSLTLRLRIGFRRLGYSDLHLRYAGVELSANGGDPTSLLNDSQTEVIYHEVDVRDDGRFEHRLLLSPTGELVLGFDALDISQKGVEHRAVS